MKKRKLIALTVTILLLVIILHKINWQELWHTFKNFDFKNATIYQELEFIFNEEDTEYHGIIDLMLEYEDKIFIIDYKLKNIDDENYIKQLNVYYNYVKCISNKDVHMYLYSILDNVTKEII